MTSNCFSLHKFGLTFLLLKIACILQLQVARDIIAKDGAGGLYKGLSAGLLRQATYTTARLGIFQIFSDMLKQQNQGKVSSAHRCYRFELCCYHTSGNKQNCQPLCFVLPD